MAETITNRTGAGGRLRATFVGAIAVVLWATLALLTTAAAPVPPFQLVALTFGVAFLLALSKWGFTRLRGGPPVFSHLRQPARVWALGVVSMLMDVSSEMIHALLPLYLVVGLGAWLLARRN